MKMLEKDLQKAVIETARRHHWTIAHFRTSQSPKGAWLTAQTGDPGFPDLILLRPPRLIAAELKGDKGRMSPEQGVWLNSLGLVEGIETYLWRPIDWHTGHIEEVLANGAKP